MGPRIRRHVLAVLLCVLTRLGDDALPNGLDVTFEVTELRRLTGSYNTMVGNNEGSMVRARRPSRGAASRLSLKDCSGSWWEFQSPFTLLSLYSCDNPWFLVVFLESIMTCFGLFENNISISRESGMI